MKGQALAKPTDNYVMLRRTINHIPLTPTD
jgi:hypothetical protein